MAEYLLCDPDWEFQLNFLDPWYARRIREEQDPTKLRLLACAFARLVLEQCDTLDSRVVDAISASEQFCRGEIPLEALEPIRHAVECAALEAVELDESFVPLDSQGKIRKCFAYAKARAACAALATRMLSPHVAAANSAKEAIPALGMAETIREIRAIDSLFDGLNIREFQTDSHAQPSLDIAKLDLQVDNQGGHLNGTLVVPPCPEDLMVRTLGEYSRFCFAAGDQIQIWDAMGIFCHVSPKRRTVVSISCALNAFDAVHWPKHLYRGKLSIDGVPVHESTKPAELAGLGFATCGFDLYHKVIGDLVVDIHATEERLCAISIGPKDGE